MKFELDEILTVIDKVKSTDLAMFEYQDADTRIRIRGTKKERAGKNKASGGTRCLAEPDAGVSAGEETVADAAGYVVTSPMVGTFYAAPSENKEPFVRIGDKVAKGQTIGIVEAMKLMNEVESEWDGVVEEIFVTNGQTVEYGQPLVRLSE